MDNSTINNEELQSLSNPLRDVMTLFDEMIFPYRPMLWRYCYHLTGSPWEAEDLVQETLIKAFSSLAQLWQPINPKGYLYRIATNTWIDQCRKMKLKMESIETIEEYPGYYEEIDSFEIEEAIEQLVLYLSPRQRVIFLLADVFKFKPIEIAEVTGITEGAAKALLNRARGKLKNLKENNMKFENDPILISNDHQEIIDLFIKAFNRRDPDGIARLLDNNISNDIVHVAKEYGKEIVRKYSLSDWAKDPVEMEAEFHYLWGRPTIVQLGKKNDSKAIYDLNIIDIENGKIVSMKDYYFCPELLNEAAKQLNLKVFERSYTLGE